MIIKLSNTKKEKNGIAEIKKSADNRVRTWIEKTPSKYKQIQLRHMHKRTRNLGFTPLNYPALDCEAHHLDKELVLYIPRDLHKSKYHNVFTGKGMLKMNGAAIDWAIDHSQMRYANIS